MQGFGLDRDGFLLGNPGEMRSSASNGMRRKSKRWQRLRIVGSTRCGSVVAEHKHHLRRRFLESFEKGVEGSRGQHVAFIHHVHLPARLHRGKAERSIRSRMLSTPVFEAASISITSSAVPAAIVMHSSQVPQGSGVGPSLLRQLRERARIRALEVLPVPLGPLNR